MANFKEIEERIERAFADLKATYELFSISPKYVTKAEFYQDSIIFDFGREDAVKSARITIDHEGYFVTRLSCWTAVTPKAVKGIEAKRFESAHDALVYGLETFEKINRFFDQF